MKQGAFQMGSDQDGFYEGPAHSVELTRPYYLGVCEVSQDQFQRIIGRNPSYTKGDNWPVEWVSWGDAIDFCAQLTARERASGWLPTNLAYRLPTEAEWEYACRAGTTNRYAFGEDAGKLAEYDWFKGNSDNHPHDVGTGKPNPWGFYDMHGSVSEWCSDWYGPYTREAVVDPTGPPTGTEHVFRGGSWMSDADSCTSTSRSSREPSECLMNRGFRVALGAVR